jgi:cbb3-type cytochrome oxidase subunit 3
METIAIFGITLIIILMLGVVTFAYKAPTIRPTKR